MARTSTPSAATRSVARWQAGKLQAHPQEARVAGINVEKDLLFAYTYNWSDEELAFHGLTRNIVRLHCGLEGAENLIGDLKQALGKI